MTLRQAIRKAKGIKGSAVAHGDPPGCWEKRAATTYFWKGDELFWTHTNVPTKTGRYDPADPRSGVWLVRQPWETKGGLHGSLDQEGFDVYPCWGWVPHPPPSLRDSHRRRNTAMAAFDVA